MTLSFDASFWCAELRRSRPSPARNALREAWLGTPRVASRGRALPFRRELLHDLEDAVEVRAAGLEVGLEEELGEAGFRVARDVLADLGEGAPERAPARALRGVVDDVGATADDVERGRVAAGRAGGVLDLGDQRRDLGQ